jgi:hypothetical protein
LGKRYGRTLDVLIKAHDENGESAWRLDGCVVAVWSPLCYSPPPVHTNRHVVFSHDQRSQTFLRHRHPLISIEEYNTLTVKQDIGPHLTNFLSKPIIKNILGSSRALPLIQDNNTDNADSNEIHNTLISPSKATIDIQKHITPTANKQARRSTAEFCKGQETHVLPINISGELP